MYNSLLIRNSYLAEVNFSTTPANGGRAYFLDIPQLREVFIQGLECFGNAEMSLSPNGKTLVASTRGIAVTLAVDSDERYYQWPCFSIQSSQQGGNIRELKLPKINLPKSYITILDSTTININESVCFNFYFRQKI